MKQTAKPSRTPCTYLFSFQVKYLLIPVPLYLFFLTFLFFIC